MAKNVIFLSRGPTENGVTRLLGGVPLLENLWYYLSIWMICLFKICEIPLALLVKLCKSYENSLRRNIYYIQI